MPPKKIKEEPKSELTNFYQLPGVKKFSTEYHEPAYKQTMIRYNSRIGVIGCSGAGKSQFILSFISNSPDTFGHIFIVHKMEEPLYQFLEARLKPDQITFYKKLSDLPQPKDLPHQDVQKLLIFDDIVNDKDQSTVCEYFLRGRKLPNGLSMAYLAQSYTKVPIFVRHQLNYLILLKVASDSDLKRIVSNYSVGVNTKQLLEMYKQAIKPRPDFLKLDIGTHLMNRKFSKNWNKWFILDPDEENED